MHAILRALILLLVATPLVAQPSDPDDRRWDGSFFDMTSAEPFLLDAFATGRDLYVAGVFSWVDGVESRGVARWDGERWRALGTGIDGWLWLVAAEGEHVYVAGASEWNELAWWNGRTWAPMGDGGVGVRGSVRVILPTGEEVIVGGDFDRAALDWLADTALPANNIALWNRATNRWSSLGDGPANGVDGSVAALARDGDTLFVGGEFDSAGALATRRLAVYDMAQRRWSSIGEVAPLPRGTRDDAFVSTIAVRGGAVVVGGRFKEIAGIAAAGAAVYDRSSRSWRGIIDDTTVRSVDRLVWHDGRLIALAWVDNPDTSFDMLITWDAGLTSYTTDTIWSGAHSLTAGDEAYLIEFARALDVRAVPRRLTASGRIALEGEFVGEQNGYIGAMVAEGGDVYATGNIPSFAGGGDVVARWSRGDRTWHRLGNGSQLDFNGYVSSMLLDGDDLYIGGRFQSIDGVTANNVAVYNRTTGLWRALPTVGGEGLKGEVSSIVKWQGGVLFGGAIDSVGSLPALGVATWSREEELLLPYSLGLPTLVSEVHVESMAAAPDALYLGGSLRYGSLGSGYGVARHNGIETVLLTPGGVDGTVHALELLGNDLYVTGSFLDIDGVEARNIVRWDGSAWQGLSSGGINGVDGYALALASVDGRLYVGGSFEQAGDAAASSIAAWDGAQWHRLGSGTNGWVYHLFADEGGVVAAGRFTRAGDGMAMGVARWSAAPSGVRDERAHPGRSLAARATPQPASDVVRLHVRLDRPGPVSVEIVDALGRVVLRSRTETTSAGMQVITLDVGAIPPGLCVARIAHGEESVAVPVIVRR